MREVAFGPDGNLYATDNSNDVIRSYNGTTGSPISGSTGWATTVGDPYGLVWNGDELYVATSRGVEYFAANATALGYFGDAQRYPSTTGAPKLYVASDVVFCPDDTMYVAERYHDAIIYYDDSDGTYLGEISGTASSPPDTDRASGLATVLHS